MADLTTVQKATVDGEDNLALLPAAFDVVSDDESVATVTAAYPGIEGYWFVLGQGAGTCTLTATRLSDDATATLEVTVEEPEPGTFTIHLGAISPK